MENEKMNTGEKIIDFIQKNRKVIFITLGILVFMFIGLIAFIYISDAVNKRDIAEIEEINDRYNKLFPGDADFYNAEDFSTADAEALLADLKTFTEKSSPIFSSAFASSRAWSLIGQIYSVRKDWPRAEEAWLNTARVGSKTYLGPVGFFNAAVAAEEQGKLEQAIELLQNSLSHSFEFPAAPRAQFSIGRLYEQLGNSSAAIEAYRTVLINWPGMTAFSNLARSRIIAIEVR